MKKMIIVMALLATTAATGIFVTSCQKKSQVSEKQEMPAMKTMSNNVITDISDLVPYHNAVIIELMKRYQDNSSITFKTRISRTFGIINDLYPNEEPKTQEDVNKSYAAFDNDGFLDQDKNLKQFSELKIGSLNMITDPTLKNAMTDIALYNGSDLLAFSKVRLGYVSLSGETALMREAFLNLLEHSASVNYPINPMFGTLPATREDDAAMVDAWVFICYWKYGYHFAKAQSIVASAACLE